MLLAAPGGASAATLVGSDLNPSGTWFGGSCSGGCGKVQDLIDGQVVETPDGVITAWSVKGMEGDMALQAYRAYALVDGELHATRIGTSETESPTMGASEGFPVRTFLTRIPVDPGDYIGLALEPGASFGFQSDPDGRLFTVDPSADQVDQETGSAQELFLQAKVEPDADGDGYGDESQDACVNCGGGSTQPSSQPSPPAPVPDPYAAIRAKGPTLSISGSATVSGKSGAKLSLRNPYAFPLRGTIALQPPRGSRKSASKRFTLAAGATKTVRVKLSKAAARKLRRKRRLKLRAVAKVRGPVGKTRTVRKTVIVRIKRERRRRRRGAPNAPSAPWRNGSYAGTWTSDLSSAPGSGQVTFTVSNGAVTSFTAPGLDVYCSGTYGGTAKQDFKAGDTRATINPDGSFSAQVKNKNEQGETLTFEGRLTSDGQASGKLRYLDADYGFNYTTCSGSAAWTARTG